MGADRVDRVQTGENHDFALYAWQDAGITGRTLLHVDAHHDMWWIGDSRHTTIANFIYPALTSGVVDRVIWVVPDATWQSRPARHALRRQLQKLRAGYPAPRDAIQLRPTHGTVMILGRPLEIYPLSRLPVIDQPVLLDVDVDFLVTPRVGATITDSRGSAPWCWPRELMRRLTASQVRTDFATIAFSVEGGYTPLRWKYLGDELRCRLTGESVEGFDSMRQALTALATGQWDHADQQLRQACRLMPPAAPLFHLALLSLDRGRSSDARALYQQAVQSDPSYRTAFASAGFPALWAGRLGDAEREHRRLLALDPNSAPAHLGLGLVSLRRRRWAEAESAFRTALALDPDSVDAQRGLADLQARKGRVTEAIAGYERSLRLALAGHRPMDCPIQTRHDGAPVVDPEHSNVHARLARLHASTGASDRAIDGYRLSIAGGYDVPWVRARLAWLYVSSGRWGAALMQLWQIVRGLFQTQGRGRTTRRGSPMTEGMLVRN